MKVKCTRILNKHTTFNILLGYRFPEFYSSIAYCETWENPHTEELSINMSNLHSRIENDPSLDYEDHLRWVRELSYSVVEK